MAQQDVSNVRVSIASLGITGTTDSSGNCSFNVPPGTYSVKFEHNDFETKTVSITVGSSGSNKDVQLIRKSVEPETPSINTNGKTKVYIYEFGTESTWDTRYAKPVPGISVNMHIDNPSYNQTKITDNNGICLFENIPHEHSTDIIENVLTIERQNGYRFYNTGSNNTVEKTVFNAIVIDSDNYNDYDEQILARAIPRKAYRLTGYVTPENNNLQAITGIKAQLISSDGTYNETITVGSGVAADIQFDNVPIGTVTLKVNHINKNTDYKSYETTFTVTNDDAAMQTYWQNQGDGKSYTFEELGIASLTYPVRLQLETVASTTVSYTINVKDAETNANLSGIPIIMYDPTTGGNSSTLISYSGTTNSSGSYTFSVEKDRNYKLDINFSPNIANPVVSGVFDYPDDKYALDCTNVNVGATDGSYNSKINPCKAKLIIRGVTYISQTDHNVVSSGPLSGVTVKIYDENQSTLLQTVTTGSDGYAIFKVEFGVTYKIVPSKSGYDVVTNSADNKVCLTYRRNSLEQQWKDGIFESGSGIQMITYQNSSSSGSSSGGSTTPETPEYIETGFFRGKCMLSNTTPVSGVTVKLTIPATNMTYTKTSDSDGIVEFTNIKLPYTSDTSGYYKFGHVVATKSGYIHAYPGGYSGDYDNVDPVTGEDLGWQSVNVDYVNPNTTFSRQILMQPT